MSEDPKKAKEALNAAALGKKKKEEQERQAQLQQSGRNPENFLHLQMILQGGKWQQDQLNEQFKKDVAKFAQNHPACQFQNAQNVSGLQNGAAMKIVGLTPQGRTLMAANFLAEQMRKNKDAQFTVNIGHDDPASAVKNFSSKNVLHKVVKLVYEKEGKNKILEPEGMKKILQQQQSIANPAAQQQNPESQSTRDAKRKPWDLRIPNKPRPRGMED